MPNNDPVTRPITIEDRTYSSYMYNSEYVKAAREKAGENNTAAFNDMRELFGRYGSIRDYRQPGQTDSGRTLSREAGLRKARILSGLQESEKIGIMNLDEQHRQNINQLMVRVNTAGRDAHVKQACNLGLRFAKTVFQDSYKALINNPTLTRDDIIERLYNIFMPYEKDLNLCLTFFETIKEGKDKTRLKKVLDIYHTVQTYVDSGDIRVMEPGKKEYIYELAGLRSTATNAIFGNTDTAVNIHKKICIKARKSDHQRAENAGDRDYQEAIDAEREKSAERRKQDESLSSEQINSVFAIDRWLLGKAHYRTTSRAFIDKIMSLSIRERLFMYGMICNDMVTVNGLDLVALTQMGYLPDVDKFSSKMTSWRFWLRARDSEILWEKLDHMYASLKGVRGAISTIADMKAEEEVWNSGTEEDKTYAAMGRLFMPEDVKAAGGDRDICLNRVIAQLEKCAKAASDYNNSSFLRRKTLQRRFNDEQEKANLYIGLYNDAVTALEALNREHEAGMETPEILREANTRPINVSDSGTILKDSLKLAGISFSLSSKPVNLDRTIKGPLQVLSGITGLISLCYGIKNVHKMRGVASTQATAAAIAGLVNSSVGTAVGISGGLATTALGIASRVPGTAAQTLGMASMVVGVSTASLSCLVQLGSTVLSTADLISQGVSTYRISEANGMISDLHLAGREGDMMTNIDRLQKRNQRQAYINKSVSMVQNAAGLGLSSLGVFFSVASMGASAAIAGVASIGLNLTVGLASRVFNYIYNRVKKIHTVDDFLKTDDLSDVIGDQNALNEEQKKKMKSLGFKEKLRDEMVAELGFSSFRTFFKYIIMKMAKFIHDKIFGRDDDNNEEERAINEEERDRAINEEDRAINEDERAAFSRYCKGLGLKVSLEKGNEKPTIAAIAQKLAG